MNENTTHRYYSPMRPVDIGTYPKGGVIAITNFDNRQHVDEIGRAAWGYIDYDRELSKAEINDFELVPQPLQR